MTEDDADATEAVAADGESETAEPAASADEPDAASEAEPEQAAADPAAAAWIVPNEPMRHWSDDSGTHHAQGWLVEMRTDRVRILKVNGRHTTVWTESLSAADRDYVSEVGGRLVAQQQGTSPAPSTTAEANFVLPSLPLLTLCLTARSKAPFLPYTFMCVAFRTTILPSPSIAMASFSSPLRDMRSRVLYRAPRASELRFGFPVFVVFLQSCFLQNSTTGALPNQRQL
jgi:hypothetical protein